MTIPITVFTGFLGAGKTSIILSLLPKLPKDYNVVLLKNEFGDVEVDSKLAEAAAANTTTASTSTSTSTSPTTTSAPVKAKEKTSALTAVSEILNGCLCCVLVGQMQSALLEIADTYSPDRIIVECSGSAFPATLAFQIRQLARDSGGRFGLDAVVTVVDAENFCGYEDGSPTARMQAGYSDVILINKWEHVSERQLDIVMDHLHTLNDLTPKIKCAGRDGVDPALIFGLDSQLFQLEEEAAEHPPPSRSHSHSHSHERTHGAHNHMDDEVQTLSILGGPDTPLHSKAYIEEKVLSALSKEVVYRLKGFVVFPSAAEGGEPGLEILNWAFGRWDWTVYKPKKDVGVGGEGERLRLTIMGERGPGLRRAARGVAEGLGAEVVGL
ncbi:hypothetical protein D9611_001441 [Ephemerocybe angulata]|uniref:CobW/HypB/UreG nucleotide-binding domain-containing protein n=1 Tax=Ephemerocybe angulata TaxID=980116 RepID=A0A8H5FM41_9AGAR|nr:hypothetical protein D9611_001441 [Tulosesus angulatus]